jgi:hypothetical protein
VLKRESREYIGWTDEAGQIQAALDASPLQRDLTGERVLFESQSLVGATLYERRGDVLERAGGIEKAETKVADDEKGDSASYGIFTGQPPGKYARNLLTTLGLAIKGQQSRVHLLVGGYDRTAVLDGSGKVEKIVDKSWSLYIPSASK